MRKILFLLVSVGIVTGIVYVYINYYRPIATGNRTGQLRQLVRRDKLFETYEGVLLGADGSSFYFSAADKEVADSLMHYIGKPVKLHYLRYSCSLPWRGDNYASKRQGRGQDIVDKVSILK